MRALLAAVVVGVLSSVAPAQGSAPLPDQRVGVIVTLRATLHQ